MNIHLIKDVSEKTNRGLLSKAWYDIDGEAYLVKGNTLGTFNSLWEHGYEPDSEVMVSNIAELLGLTKATIVSSFFVCLKNNCEMIISQATK